MDTIALLSLAIIAASLYILLTRGDIRHAVKSFVAAVLFFLSISLFWALFIDPIKQWVLENKLLAFAVWLLSTVLLAYVLGREVPWI